jgi:hypothetical protein
MSRKNKSFGIAIFSLLGISVAISSCTRGVTVCECHNITVPAQHNYKLKKRISWGDATKQCASFQADHPWDTCYAKEIK